MDTILKVKDLQVHFPIGRRGLLKGRSGFLRAVDGIDLEIRRGETLGLVGESGSGKTTLGRALLRAIEPTAGRILYDFGDERGDLVSLDRRSLRRRWRKMQMIFQDPYSSLNPRMTVRDVIAEPLVANRLARGKALDRQVREIAGLCGLRADHLARFPHAFSGGQRQRIAIARALILRPLFIVCDEPVSALDVSIQAQILNLLKELQRELALTYLFIAHDLAAVAYASDRVAVMYLGKIVELAPTERLYYGPRHPYTEALMAAIPPADPEEHMAPVLLQGERPSPANPPSGCRFHTRCRYTQPRCRSEAPALREVATGHLSACHFAETLTLKGAKELADGAAVRPERPQPGRPVKTTIIGEGTK